MLDHLAFALLHAGDFGLASQAAILLCDKSPVSEKGWLRLGDIAFKQEMYKRAMLAYGHMLHIPGVTRELADHAVERITTCADYTEWAQIFRGNEHEQLPPSLARYLLEPWSPNVREMFFNIYSGARSPALKLYAHTELNIRVTSTESKRLLRFFRWLVPFQFAVSPIPRSEEDISLLSSAHLGIKHIISLTEWPTIDQTWFQGKPIKRTLIPIQDFCPPTIEQVECIMEIIMNPSNMPALIHCTAGMGRTGTIAACYLVAFGFNSPKLGLESPTMEAADAISALRALRPGSVETAEQEALVAKWASVIWKRRSVLRPVVNESPPCSLEVIGEIPPDADLVVLMGLQGMCIYSIPKTGIN
jgi:atypical dual specificity phosphatase